MRHTVELEKLLVAGLGGKLLGVDNSLLEGRVLRGSHFDGCEGRRYEKFFKVIDVGKGRRR